MNLKGIITFLIQCYERIITVLVLLVLVVFSFWLFMKVGSLQEDIKATDEARPTPVRVQEYNVEEFEKTFAAIEKPPSWTTNTLVLIKGESFHHRLFVGPPMKHLKPTDSFPTYWDKGRGINIDGIPYAWLETHNLSLSGSVADLDPDGDGFTNMEEFKANPSTDPMDSNSKPDLAQKLRIGEKVGDGIYRKPFPVFFDGVDKGAEGKQKFKIRRGKPGPTSGKTDYLEMDKEIPGRDMEGWKIIHYEKKNEKRINKKIKNADGKYQIDDVDVSEVTLQKEGSAQVVLIFRQPGTTGDFFVKLLFLIDNKVYEVTQGEFFMLQNVQYQVVVIKNIDGKDPEVVIKRVDSEKPFPLLPLKPEDLKKPSEPAKTPTP